MNFFEKAKRRRSVLLGHKAEFPTSIKAGPSFQMPFPDVILIIQSRLLHWIYMGPRAGLERKPAVDICHFCSSEENYCSIQLASHQCLTSVVIAAFASHYSRCAPTVLAELITVSFGGR